MKARLKLVQFIDTQGFKIFDSTFRGKAIAETCEGKADGKTHGESWVRHLLWQWWYYGGDPLAFVPNYSVCGAQSRETIIAKAEKAKTSPVFKRQYRTKAACINPNAMGCEITPEMYELIVATIAEVLEDDDKRSGLSYIVQRTRGLPWTVFRDEIHKAISRKLGNKVTMIDGKPARATLTIDQLPNRDQIRYIGRKILHVPTVLKKIKGSRAFALEHRGLTGNSNDIATRAGQVYEIDSEEIDLHSVNDETFLPLGRLFVYFVVDVYSKAIVGVYVTCGDPDYRQVAMALHAAFMPKSKWGELIGMQISDEEWFMHGKPDSLLGDGGDIARIASNILPELATVDVANTPPCRGDLKAQVEQGFELADIGTIRFLPGATKGPRLRMTIDPAKKAKLSVMKITHSLTRWAYEVHNIRNISGSAVDPELIGRQIELTPNGLWKDSVRKYGPLPIYDIDTHLPRMMERNLAEVTRRGLLLGGVYFDRPTDSIFKRLKEGATTFGTPRHIAVHFDRLITKQIYIVPKNPDDPLVIVPLASISSKWHGFTFKEIEDAIEESNRRAVSVENKHHLAKINHGIRVDKDVLEATDQIVDKYRTIQQRNRIATSIGTEIPRSDQLKKQLATEAEGLPNPTVTSSFDDKTTEAIAVPIMSGDTAEKPQSPVAAQTNAGAPLRPVYF
jgi:hypothetical protein